MKTWLILLLIGSIIALDAQADEIDYLRDIKPLLAEKCSACHGALKHEAGLRLDAGTLIRAGSTNGNVLEPGQAMDSLLIERVVETDFDQRMPPEGVGESLNAKQVEILKKWINQGAVIPEHEAIPGDPRDHWAYQIPHKTVVPDNDDSQSSNPIDSFIRSKQSALGLESVGQADGHTLLRRLYFDLIGLPPSTMQLEDFLSNPSPEAWNDTVDELLNRPQYGERWGRHWMDVWRYSDWDGYKQQLRGSQRHIWHWRDWIIHSLNSDKPYDQMIVEMLAADEVTPTDSETLAATGFLARNYHKSNRNIWLDATVEHTAKAFLGMTLNCARCHDHKYDPIPQRTYYEFRAIFEPHQVRTDRVPGQLDIKLDGIPRAFDADLSASTFLFEGGNEKKPDEDSPIDPGTPSILGGTFQIQPVALPVESYVPALREFVVAEQRAVWKNQLVNAENKLKESAIAQGESFVAHNYAVTALQYAVAALRVESFEARLAADQVKIDEPESEPLTLPLAVTAASTERKLNAKLAELAVAQKELALNKLRSKEPGNPKQKAAIAKAKGEFEKANKKLQAARSALNKQDAKYTPLNKQYPKTSSGRRLALARWIGSKNNPLTARVAVNQIWMRHFGEPLVDNIFDFGLRSPKPKLALLLDWLAVEFMENGWSQKHIHRLIVTSQTWQQASSSNPGEVANNNRSIDPDNKFLWRMNARRLDAEIIRDNVLSVSGQLDSTIGGPDIDFRKGESTRRRSVYLRHAYEKQMRMLVLFDAANPNECYRRSESVVPQQALALINSSICLDNSRLLARQLWTEHASGNEKQNVEFLNAAFLQILGRPPSRPEIDASLEFLVEQTELLSDTKALDVFVGGKPATVKPADNPESRARENLVHVLMNHNDFVTVR